MTPLGRKQRRRKGTGITSYEYADLLLQMAMIHSAWKAFADRRVGEALPFSQRVPFDTSSG